jgi:uncharacterized membrane protein (DUF485 family)
MAGFGHGPAQAAEQEDPREMERNARNGMFLFLVYFAFYAGFVALNGFWPKQMDATPAWGINLAILYGGGLIVAAMVLALVYSWLCRSGQKSAEKSS